MHLPRRFTDHFFVLAAVGALVFANRAGAQTTGSDLEAFVLADDRDAILQGGLPGDPLLRRLRCLHLIHEGRFEELDVLLEAWRAEDPEAEELAGLEARCAIAGFELDPERAWALLDKQFPLRGGGPAGIAEAGNTPVGRIDPEAFSQSRFLAESRRDGATWVRGLSEAARWSLPWSEWTREEARFVLNSDVRPDAGGVLDAVQADLRKPGDFGNRSIHQALLREQLDRWAAADPRLLEEKKFVQAYLDRLRPNPDVDAERRGAARRAWLAELLVFSERLPERWDGLRAQVLFHQRTLDRALGTLNETDFRNYLEAGPATEFSPRAFRDERRSVDFSPDLDSGLDPVSPQEHDLLVRESLLDFLGDAESPTSYSRWVDEDTLDRLFVEAQLLAGREPGPWLDLVDDPKWLEAIEARVELRFPSESKLEFAADAPVAIELVRKGVSEMYVEVHKIDAEAYYREVDQEVPANLDLSGHRALREQRYVYSDSSFRRVRERFEFPEFAGPGVYLVRFAAEGFVSQVLVRKGSLSFETKPTAAGQRVRVFDELGRQVQGAELVVDGQLFRAEPDGDVFVPFSERGGSKEVLLRGARRVARGKLPALTEDYTLALEAWMDSEQQLEGLPGRILVRPHLQLAGQAVSLDWLKEPVLVVRGFGRDGVSSSFRAKDLSASDFGEGVFELPIPDLAGNWSLQWKGEVPSMLKDEALQLESSQVSLGGALIHGHGALAAPLLGRTSEGYVVDILGRGGEPRPNRTLRIVGRHAFYPAKLETVVRTNERGRVILGELEGLSELVVIGEDFGSLSFRLEEPSCRWPATLHLERGEAFSLPVANRLAARRPPVSLLETNERGSLADRGASLRWNSGGIVCAGLGAGNYDLWLPSTDQRVVLRVTERSGADGALAADRRLERRAKPELTIQGLSVVPAASVPAGTRGEQQLVLQLGGTGAATRVHLVATTYAPSMSLDQALRISSDPAPGVFLRDAIPSDYLFEQPLGSEERYILARRFSQRFAGSLLARPGLLLQPWVREDATVQGMGGGIGGGAGSIGGKASGRRSLSDALLSSPPTAPSGLNFADRSFLPEPGLVLPNLRPDEQGRIVLDLGQLRGRNWIEVCALDGEQQVAGRVFAESVDWSPRELRHEPAQAGPEAISYSSELRVLRSGQPLPEGRPAENRWMVTGSLEKTFDLLLEVCADPELEKFSFLKEWDELEPEARLELYGRFACHELNLFLRFRDPSFFSGIVKPYLANKLQKTFVDRLLLGEDLSRYLEPAAFAKLGLIEQALLAGELSPDRTRAFWQEQRASSPWDRRSREGRVQSAMRSAWLDPELRAEMEALAPAPSETDFSDFEAEPGGPFLVKGNAEEALRIKRIRARARSLYRAPGHTQIWSETHWWRRTLDQGPPPCEGHEFWADYAQRDRAEAFVSKFFLEAAGSGAEALVALAVTNLPWSESSEAAGDQLLFLREPKALADSSEERPILLAREVFRADWAKDQRTRDQLARSEAAENLGELEPGITYGVRWVITNPSPNALTGELSLSLPTGTLALDSELGERQKSLSVPPWGQQLVVAWIYFPLEGPFELPAAHVTTGGERLASFPAESIAVQTRVEPRRVTWPEIARHGSPEEIVAYLAGQESLASLDWRVMESRFRDRAVWEAVLARVEPRAGLVEQVWLPAIFHRDAKRTREFLSTQAAFLRRTGPYVSSPLLQVDPFEDLSIEHIEFSPIHNARSQPVNGSWAFSNLDLKNESERLLLELAHKPALDATDRLRLCDLFLASDRIADAIEQFERIDPNASVSRLQRDYLACWLALAREDLAAARAAAEPHANHPVARWRERFQASLAVIEQAETGVASLVRTGHSNSVQAAKAPVLELTGEGGSFALRFRGPGPVTVGFYPLDVESRFSNAPFDSSDAAGVPFVEPSSSLEFAGEDGLKVHILELPADLIDTPTTVVARHGALRRQVLLQPSSLDVELVEAFGRLTVRDRDSNKPLSRIYVKVYRIAATGEPQFHKDGTTDVLGRFDYTSVTPPPDRQVERYAILIQGERLGAVVLQVRAPGR